MLHFSKDLAQATLYLRSCNENQRSMQYFLLKNQCSYEFSDDVLNSSMPF